MTSHTPSGIPYVDPDDTLVDYPIESLELANYLQQSHGYYSTLPAAPLVGARTLLNPPGSSAIWDLLWIGSAWQFLGGPPLWAFDASDVDLGGPGGGWSAPPPALTIPYGGFYIVSWGHEYYDAASATGNGSSQPVGPGVGIGAVSPFQPAPALQWGVLSASTQRMVQFTAPGTVQIQHSTSNWIHTVRRWLSLTPIYLTP